MEREKKRERKKERAREAQKVEKMVKGSRRLLPEANFGDNITSVPFLMWIEEGIMIIKS